MRPKLSLLTLGLVVCALTSAQDDVEKRAQEISTKLVSIQHNWGPKISSPGANLIFKENGRGEMNGKQYVSFRLFQRGLPNNLSYSVGEVLINLEGREMLNGFSFDQTGMAICAGTPDRCGTMDKPNDPIDFQLMALPGEPLRIFISADGGLYKAAVSVVPFRSQAPITDVRFNRSDWRPITSWPFSLATTSSQTLI